DLVQNLPDQLLALLEVERCRLCCEEVVDHLADRVHHLLAGQLVEAGQVQPLDQLAVNPALDLLEEMLLRTGARGGGGPRWRRGVCRPLPGELETRLGRASWLRAVVLAGGFGHPSLSPVLRTILPTNCPT